MIKFLLLILLLTNGALAQLIGYKAELGFSFHPRDSEISTFSLSPKFGIDYLITTNLHANLTMGFSYTVLNVSGYLEQNSFDFGNPIITILKKLNNSSLFKNNSIAIGVGIPLATYPGSIPENRMTEQNFLQAMSSYGFNESSLWMLNVVPIMVTGITEVDLGKDFSWRIKLQPNYAIAINSRPDNFQLSAMNELVYSSESYSYSIGIHSFAQSESLENNDLDQTSILLSLNRNFDSHSFGGTVIINIDKPYGFQAKTPKPFLGFGVNASW